MEDYGFERAKKFIVGHTWKFASSMPYIPHWYCLKEEHNDIEEFELFVRFIRQKSRVGKFGGKEFHYFYLNGFKYWDMDATPETCDLVNRDMYKMDFIDTSPYVPVSEDKEELEYIRERLKGIRGSVLNVGCGDGVLLDILPSTTKYVGLDIRENYVKNAHLKHPEGYFIVDSIKNIHIGEPDNIIGVFGGVAMDEEGVDRLIDWMKEDTKIFLMLSKEQPIFDGLIRICSSEDFKDYVVYTNFR